MNAQLIDQDLRAAAAWTGRFHEFCFP